MILPALSDYVSSRAALLALAEQTGGSASRWDHPLTGPAGEPLCTDVIRYGAAPGEADTVIVVAAGTHGVEGHAGNGVQRNLLSRPDLLRLPPRAALVLIHAVNPYGFAWSRRVDHENIDVNRNFVDLTAPLPANPHYGDLDAILNPTDAVDVDDDAYVAQLAPVQERLGQELLYRTIVGGQYTHPHGVQYGGDHVCWSRATLTSIWTEHVADARVAITHDVHTGLGRRGQLIVFQTVNAEEHSAELGARWFGDLWWRSDRPGRVDSIDKGLHTHGFDDWFDARTNAPSDSVSVFVSLEFGTHGPQRGLSAMRADNWLHRFGDPFDARGLAIRARMRDQFFGDDEAWRQAVGDQAMTAIERTIVAVRDGETG